MERRVYIVDDDPLSRDTLEEIIALLPDVRCEQIESGIDLLARLPHLGPGVVLIDLKMPDLSGLDVLARFGEARDRLPTIMMSVAGDIPAAVEAMRLGALDFLEKPCTPRALLEKLNRGFVALDAYCRSTAAHAALHARFASLSERESEVLRQLIDGKVNREIAELLNLSVRTVEVYRAKLMMKLGVESLAEAVRLAITSGFVHAEAA
ncbi:MAG: hypothetical protein A4S16_07140 [Proteobacteria bacterium SG_bin6]|nr:MAG: hypothetical protein A4S16_07140 [Proteobacteria bacterium SG_bin6]